MPVSRPDELVATTLMGFNITGDLGGITYVQDPKGRRLSFAKTFPTQRPTAFQLMWRAKFAAAMDGWKALSPTQQATLKEITRRYQFKVLAHNVYVSCYLWQRLDVIAEWAADLGLPW